MPAPPAALMVPPVRPAPPENGTAQALLEHAVEFGGYVSELENQNTAWREWAASGKPKVDDSNSFQKLNSSGER